MLWETNEAGYGSGMVWSGVLKDVWELEKAVSVLMNRQGSLARSLDRVGRRMCDDPPRRSSLYGVFDVDGTQEYSLCLNASHMAGVVGVEWRRRRFG